MPITSTNSFSSQRKHHKTPVELDDAVICDNVALRRNDRPLYFFQVAVFSRNVPCDLLAVVAGRPAGDAAVRRERDAKAPAQRIHEIPAGFGRLFCSTLLESAEGGGQSAPLILRLSPIHAYFRLF